MRRLLCHTGSEETVTSNIAYSFLKFTIASTTELPEIDFSSHKRQPRSRKYSTFVFEIHYS
jgi:hypothetical protein